MKFAAGLFWPLLTALIIVGCANPPIVSLGTELFLLSKEDHAGIFGSMAKLKADTIREMNDFAKKRGKEAVPVSVREKPVGNTPGDWASVACQFKLVDRSSPETSNASINTNRQTLPVRPNFAVQGAQNINADVTVRSSEQKDNDIYTKLLKLDDLKKRGIITDTEFQEQKSKILQGK